MLYDITTIRFGILLLASLAPGLLWFFWYGALFGPRWEKETQLNDRTIRRAHVVRIFLLSFVAMYLSAAAISLTINGLSINFSVVDSMTTAAVLSLLPIGALTLLYQFAQRSVRLLAIDSGYFFISYLLMGLVIGWLS